MPPIGRHEQPPAHDVGRPIQPASVKQRQHGVDPDRQPDHQTQIDRSSASTGMAGVGPWRELVARHHMCAISCSTRSSTLRNGSLHSTVRCA